MEFRSPLLYVDWAQVRTLRPTWDLPKVLEHLSKFPFEPLSKASLRNLSIKTALLVQLASGRRGSWMHACKVDEATCARSRGDGVFSRCGSWIRIRDRNLPRVRCFCPVWRIYPRTTGFTVLSGCWTGIFHVPVRLEERKDSSLSLRGSRAAQSTIAGWVREAINSAYRDLSAEERREWGLRAHDTRGVAASWALLARVPFQEIMDAAAWKTPVTFARPYLKDLPNLKGRFGRAVISTAGSSGGAKTTTA